MQVDYWLCGDMEGMGVGGVSPPTKRGMEGLSPPPTKFLRLLNFSCILVLEKPFEIKLFIYKGRLLFREAL